MTGKYYEINTADCSIRFPEFLTLIREVTDDKNYKNAALAKI